MEKNKEINIPLVKHLEDLALIKLTDKEREQMVDDLNDVVDMFETLNEVDEDELDPLIHLNNASQKLDSDKETEHLDRDVALQNSKAALAPYFTVPKVIKKNG